MTAADKTAPEIVASQKRAAALLGITDRNLRFWMQEPGFPDCRGGYNLPAIRAWREVHERKGSQTGAQGTQLNQALKLQQFRLSKAKADRAEREERERQKDILSRAEAETTIMEIITTARDLLAGLPKKLARSVPPKHQRRLISEGEKIVAAVLEQMARQAEEEGLASHEALIPE